MRIKFILDSSTKSLTRSRKTNEWIIQHQIIKLMDWHPETFYWFCPWFRIFGGWLIDGSSGLDCSSTSFTIVSKTILVNGKKVGEETGWHRLLSNPPLPPPPLPHLFFHPSPSSPIPLIRPHVVLQDGFILTHFQVVIACWTLVASGHPHGSRPLFRVLVSLWKITL